MAQNLHNSSLEEDLWKWKALYSNYLQTGKEPALEKITMTNAKYKLEVPGYTKENITVTQLTDEGFNDVFGYWNPPEKYINVKAENKEFGLRTKNIFPRTPFENVQAEVKNGILYLDWDTPKESAPVTVRVD